MFASAGVSAIIAVSESGAHVEIPDWVVGILVLSICFSLVVLCFRFLRLLK